MVGNNILTYNSKNHTTSMTSGATAVTMKYDRGSRRQAGGPVISRKEQP
jgi:hypothetical protein